jgi:hypothetical protein
MTAQISTPTKCRLCGKTFSHDLLATAAVLGSNPQIKAQQIQALVAPFIKHIEKDHPQHIQMVAVTSAEIQGYLMMSIFDMDDQIAEKLNRDFVRWKIRQWMTPPHARVTDERIKERLNAVPWESISPSEELILFNIIREMRDAIEERGRYKMPGPNGQPG